MIPSLDYQRIIFYLRKDTKLHQTIVMRTFLKLLLPLVLLSAVPQAAGAKEKPLRFASDPDAKLMKFKAKVVKTDETYTVRTKGEVSGFSFSGDWDMRGYSKLRFKVKNLDGDAMLHLYVHIQDEPKKVGKPRAYFKKGTFSCYRTLEPGESREVTIDLPAELPHPEIAAKFKRMKRSPYDYGTRTNGYNVDWSSIHRVKFLFYAGSSGHRFEISDVEAVPGKRSLPKNAPWLTMDEGRLFPFIDRYGQFKHEEWKGKIHSDADLEKARKAEETDLAANPGPDGLDKFGGWADGPKYEATGHFRVEKIDGKWWLIDPEGRLFWSHGVVRVSPSSAITPLDGRLDYFEWLPEENSDYGKFYYTHDALLKPYYTARKIKRTYDFSSSNLYRKYGKDYLSIYSDLAHRRLRSWGLNTIANSSDIDICKMDRTPYIDRIEINESPVLEGAKGGWWNVRDPFDPGFEQEIRRKLEGVKERLDDPWCIGYFVDNEMKWHNDKYLAQCTVKASSKGYAKKEMIKFFQEKYTDIQALNKVWGTSFPDWEALLENRNAAPKAADSDMKEFNEHILRGYFGTIRRIFKEIAPQKLYMGCRFAGSNKQVISIGAEYCDIMSWNTYRTDLRNWLDDIRSWFDKPVMIGEFHFGALDRGKFHPSLIGMENQEQRGRAYYNYVKSALEHDLVVGTHWHQFADQATTGRFDGENLQVGMTDMCDTPYYETIAKIREIGYKMYKVRSGK